MNEEKEGEALAWKKKNLLKAQQGVRTIPRVWIVLEGKGSERKTSVGVFEKVTCRGKKKKGACIISSPLRLGVGDASSREVPTSGAREGSGHGDKTMKRKSAIKGGEEICSSPVIWSVIIR